MGIWKFPIQNQDLPIAALWVGFPYIYFFSHGKPWSNLGDRWRKSVMGRVPSLFYFMIRPRLARHAWRGEGEAVISKHGCTGVVRGMGESVLSPTRK